MGTIRTGANKGCTLNSDMDTTCTKKTDSVADSCPSETHHCHPDHAKTIKTGANKGCTLNSDMDPAPQPCPDNMINPMSCECGTETSNNNNGCPVTKCRSNCKQIEAAANVVTASLEVAGVKESDLVADKSMQTGIIKGFSTATGVGVSQIAITQIGTTKLNTRRLQDKLAIKFAITSDSPEDAKKLQAMVQSTSAADISNGIKAAGIAGVTATSSPTATVAESVTPVIAVTVTSSGLSDGEKAGIAIGVILGVVALGAAMFLCKPASPSKNEYQNKPVQASQTESSLSGYGQ